MSQVHNRNSFHDGWMGGERIGACVFHHIHKMVILNNDPDEVYVNRNGIHNSFFFILLQIIKDHKPVNSTTIHLTLQMLELQVWKPTKKEKKET